MSENGYFIAIKTKDSKTAQLLGSRGRLTRRYVHAVRDDTFEAAERQCADIREEAPEWMVSCAPKAIR